MGPIRIRFNSEEDFYWLSSTQLKVRRYNLRQNFKHYFYISFYHIVRWPVLSCFWTWMVNVEREVNLSFTDFYFVWVLFIYDSQLLFLDVRVDRWVHRLLLPELGSNLSRTLCIVLIEILFYFINFYFSNDYYQKFVKLG